MWINTKALVIYPPNIRYAIIVGFAIASALFAALTVICQRGLKNVQPGLAIAIRMVIILVVAWGIVFYSGFQRDIFFFLKVMGFSFPYQP